jgi:predicted Rossmann fold flavoprotein
MSEHLIVIGGGAAGFFCAVNAARMNPSLKVTMLEKSQKLLSKVRISGGGRCNVTHACFEIPELIKKYPRGKNFVKRAFHHFSTQDTIDWFSERGVAIVAEDDGRMFPAANTSEAIINCLLDEAGKYKVDIQLKADVEIIEKKENQFTLTLSDGRKLTADKVCITSGGFPKAEQFDWIRQTGHSIADPVPSLFTFNIPDHPITSLMGVSVEDAIVKINQTQLKERGPVLITHWGLSGPAVLKLSAWGARILHELDYSFSVQVNWIPAYTEETLRAFMIDYRTYNGGVFIGSKNPFGLPHRLWQFLLLDSAIMLQTRWSDLPVKQQNVLIQQLCAYTMEVKGKTTFKEEFVTAGGVTLTEVDVNTMQSKIVPGLFFAGEVLDVDGVTGGFNFQHAWTSAWIAAKAVSS